MNKYIIKLNKNLYWAGENATRKMVFAAKYNSYREAMRDAKILLKDWTSVEVLPVDNSIYYEH